MHLRTVLRGILKRRNSSSTTHSAGTSSDIAESRPTSSSGGLRLGSRIKNLKESITEAEEDSAIDDDCSRSGSRFSNNNHQSHSHKTNKNNDRSKVNQDVTESGDLGHLGHFGGAEDKSPGQMADDRRLAADGIKLHMNEAAPEQVKEEVDEKKQEAFNPSTSTTAVPSASEEGEDVSILSFVSFDPEPSIDQDQDQEDTTPKEEGTPVQVEAEAEAEAEADAQGEAGTTVIIPRHGDSDIRPTLLVQCPSSDRVDTTPTLHTINKDSDDKDDDITHTQQDKRVDHVLSIPSPTLITPPTSSVLDYYSSDITPLTPALSPDIMVTRKIWVKRPSASPTLVSIREDDLVDDVRDMILRKYSNSLGRSFDSPDVTLRIISRSDGQRGHVERMLGPEEDMCRTLDSYYPNGQTVDEALIIDVPVRRTPRPSPRILNHYHQSHPPLQAQQAHQAHQNHQNALSYHILDEFRPLESGSDYFPPMPMTVPVMPAVIPSSAPTSASAVEGRTSHPSSLANSIHAADQRSISVLSTGQIPPLPSPGSVRRHREHPHRPKYPRQHTASPTIVSSVNNPNSNTSAPTSSSQHLPIRTSRPRGASNASEKQHPNANPAPPPLPTPPVSDAPAPNAKPAGTPPTPSTRDTNTLRPSRPRRSRKPTPTNGTPAVKSPGPTSKSSLAASLLDNSVPPINVLIVEDNMINLKLLEAFMKRLKVRWSTAMNGQIAVNKWRAGGFHLVLMDIQLPIMSGLEATREIRRLERVNGIGVFSNSTPSTPALVRNSQDGLDGSNAIAESKTHTDAESDKLNVENGLFKSPVIIVALTASSLQSDRHEALAAGCNDFLTKPVNFVWLERKVKEWGCMQALIDFDGWRKWKDFTSENKKAKRVSRASLDPPAITRPAASNDTAAAAATAQNGSAIESEDAPVAES